MHIRPLAEADAGAWWHIRKEALEQEPFAFGKDLQEHQQTPVETIAVRFRNRSDADFTLGAFENAALVGIVTFARETGLKEKHKAHIFGVYVTQAHRGRGIGKALMTAVLEKVKNDATLEQILLAVAVGQTAAQNLYQSLGFTSYGIEPHALKIGGAYIDEDHLILKLR